VFDPATEMMKCPACGRTEAVNIPPGAHVAEESFDAAMRNDPSVVEKLSDTALQVTCSGCGSIVEFQPPKVAGSCPFCAAQIVAQPVAADSRIAPSGVLPFHITKQQAFASIRTWVSSRWFAPSALARLASQDTARGVYIPFWTYSADTYSTYSGARGEHYYETEWVTEQDDQGNQRQVSRQVQRTMWYPASGRVSNRFDDILVTATKAVNRNRINDLEPWDLPQLKPYEPEFLSGFEAQRYQVPLNDGFEESKQIMQGEIQSTVRQAIGGDEQRIDGIQTNYMNITFKHILLPVWIGAYRFQGKVFQVVVNARTGEVKGERPYSASKIVLLVAAIILVIIIIASLSHK
jgi:ribosomal protein S27E